MKLILSLNLLIFEALFLTNSYSITLDESIIYAKTNSDEIAIENFKVDLSKTEVTSAWQNFLPNVFYQMQRGKGKVNAPAFDRYNVPYPIKTDIFSVEQDLSLQSLIPNQIQKLSALKSSIAKYRLFVNEITIKVVDMHLSIFIAQNNLEMAKILNSIAGQDRHNTNTKNLLGLINNNEAMNFDVKYDNSEAQMIQSQIFLDNLKSQYQMLTRIRPENLELPVKFHLPALNLKEYLLKVERQNLSTEEINARLSIANAAKFQSYTDLFIPKFRANYSDSRSVVSILPGNPEIRQQQIVGTMEITLYDRGKKFENISQSKIYSRMINRELSLMKENLKIEAEKLWNQHHSLFLIQRSNKDSLDITNSHFNTAQAKYKNGSISKVEFLNYTIALYNAKINYLRSYKDFVLNYYKILSLI